MLKFILSTFVFACLLTTFQPTAMAQGAINCTDGLKYLSVGEASDCRDEFDTSEEVTACQTFLNQHTQEEIQQKCIVTKEYELPAIPRPTGVPVISSEDLEDVRDVRSFFINNLFPRVTKLLIWGIGLVGFFMALFSGIRYSLTFGKEERATDAKQSLIYALVGILVAFMSFALVQIIGSLPF